MKMANGIFISLRLLAIFVPLSGALYEQNWTSHGIWSQNRSIRKILHFSCTLPTPAPVDVFIVNVTSNTPFPLKFSETWSLELLSTNEDKTQFIFQSLRKMYPPRIVLNFHYEVFGFLIPSGTCTFEILNERLTISTSPTTTVSLNFLPDFVPGLIIPDDTAGLTTDFTTTDSTWSPEFEIGACIESQILFPDWNYQYVGDEPLPYDSTSVSDDTNNIPPELNSKGSFPLNHRSKRLSLLPDPEFVDPSGSHGSHLIPPLLVPGKIWLNYTDAIEMSMMFYAAQRSGSFEKVPLDTPYEWMRPSGAFHSAADGRDLTGGWYNGNDNVKLTFPMAAATSVLAWGYDTWKDVYVTSGLDEMFKETIKWPLDYFLKSWDPGTQTLYVQIGDLGKERSLWNRADDFVYTTLWNNNQWPVYSVSPANPGSDVAAEVATAMALSSLIEFDDKAYTTKLRQTAKEIYQFAKNYPGKYSDSVPVGGEGFPDYTSSGHVDELCFAATVLYNVTGSNTFLSDATTYFSTFENTGTPDFFSWDDKRVACAIMLYKITKENKYGTYVHQFREKWMSSVGTETPFGLAWKSENGTLRYTANAIFILLEGIEAGVFEPNIARSIYPLATKQVEYILGQNNMNRSYLIGYGDSHVRNPYHKNSACPHPAKQCGWEIYNNEMENKNILVGALVGGPDLNDFHADNRQNTLGNSVAVDYNAGFQSVLAGLQSKKEALRKECDDLIEGVDGGSWTSESTTGSSFSPTSVIDPEMTQTTSLPVTTPTTPYTTTQPTPIPNKPEVFDYADALRKSILFYAAQRSGLEPDNNPIPWRQWDYIETATSGGWFDDGSAVKTTKVMASAVTLLGWGALKFKAGYETAGALTDLYDCLRWPLDYFIKIWRTEDESLVRKVGNEAMERAYWSQITVSSTARNFNEMIILDRTARVGQGAEVGADVVTALAIGSVLFKEEDYQYSGKLLTTAKEVYKFATKLDSTSVDYSSVYYSDPGPDFGDEMCVAAWWMYKATQDSTYYNDGMLYLFRNTTDFTLDWKNKDPLCQMLIYEHTGSLTTSFLIQQMFRQWIDTTTFTPQGLAWHDVDSLKLAANMAFTQVLAKSYGIMFSDTNFYKTQIDYMLGNNDRAFSYQIGYGERYPRRPHHRASSCPDYMNPCDWSIYNAPWKNPHDLIGALVSGPDVNDVYEDVRSNYTMNRVSVEYNAGFQSVLAYLAEQFPMKSTRTSSTTMTTTTTRTTTTTPTTQKVPNTTRRSKSTVQTTASVIRPNALTKTPMRQTSTSTAGASTTTKGRTTESSPSTFTKAKVDDKNATPTVPVPDNQISATTSIYNALNTFIYFALIQLVCFISFL